MEKKLMKKKLMKKVTSDDDDGEDMWWYVVQKGIIPSFICISLFALLIRVSVSLHPYSGAGNPPKYGDYEAQRHWMEITLNLPSEQWYRNGTTNDLNYWGLDYPLLTAYQSYVHGVFIRFVDPSSVALYSSRGYESYIGKLLMRWTVLASDALVFFPAVLYFVLVYSSGISDERKKSSVAWLIFMVLLNPSLILIDHGHFQYNCISLGLVVAAVAAVLSDRDLLASVLFSLALNHKQMSAYFAPAFFSHLLGKCLRRQNPLLEMLKLGLAVAATFTVVWWPYVNSMNAILEVFSRLVPFQRGIYEDYVANFWCTTSVLVKWKRLFSTESLKLFSLAATVFTCLPSMIQQIRMPSSKGFLYGLMNSAFSFYLFSFQVHEKSILLPLLPASLLAIEESFLFQWFTQYALLSMFPLLCRDRLVLPYIALSGLFILFYNAAQGNRYRRNYFLPTNLKSLVMIILDLCYLILHLVYLTAKPPQKYPFLFEAMIMLLCFSQFLVIAIYANKKQWMLLDNGMNMMASKKKKV